MGVSSQMFNPLARRINGQSLVGSRLYASARAAVKPPAIFPGAVATDSDLLLGQNRIVTTLVTSISATDTTIRVVDPTAIVPDMVLSLGRDGEIVKVVGAGTGQAFPVQRGFDGTLPVAHAAGSAVLGNIVAFHHNALVAEIEAIEEALGANLSNLPGARSGILLSVDYDFQQNPGGNLAVGSNTVAMNPIPPGLLAGFVVCISGGTGPTEAAPVVSVGVNQIVINCAFAHSGAWRISSATSGIQEAINSLPAGGGLVYVPGGRWPLCGQIVINRPWVNLRGSGRSSTVLTANFSDVPMISIPTAVDLDSVSDMTLVGASSSSTQFAISLIGSTNTILKNLAIVSFYNGISVTGACFRLECAGIFISGISGDGVFINSTVEGGSWSDIIIGGNQGTNASIALHLTACVGLELNVFYSLYCAHGMWVDPPVGSSVQIVNAFDAYFDGYFPLAQLGIMFASQGGEIAMLNFLGGGVAGFGAGVLQQGGGLIADVLFTNFLAIANQNTGITLGFLAGQTLRNIFFTNCTCAANGLATPGTNEGLRLNNCTNVIIQGGVYAANSYGQGGNTQAFGITIGGNNTDVQINNAVLAPNLNGPLFVNGPNPGLTVKDCIGYNPVGPSAVTVTASPFTYTSGFTPETIYIQGGSGIEANRGGFVIANPTAVTLAPNTTVVITYTTAPTIFRDVE